MEAAGRRIGIFQLRPEQEQVIEDTMAGRDVVMAVVETIAGSRDGDGQLTGEVRITDFVSVHIDGIVERAHPDPRVQRLQYIQTGPYLKFKGS